jgi:tRNA-splicing ligase RtcB
MEKSKIGGDRLPIYNWCRGIEDGAMVQARNLANLPFAFHHIAIMPDSHQGYGMPIGTVLATKGVVIPNAVGVDIGCGMCAMRTNIPVDRYDFTEKLKDIMGLVRDNIPVGFNHHKAPSDVPEIPYSSFDRKKSIVWEQHDKSKYQIGTLGGGNHFIEFQKDEENRLWVMIHSGSRNLGHRVATHYNNLAKKLNKRWHSSVRKEDELAFFPIETKEARDYMAEMNYCIEFALANRLHMMEVIKTAIDMVIKFVDYEEIINESHNFARWEHHYGSDVVVHRKGATSAREGEIGMIPGSQGTSSYIVEGKGNPESFTSCSHGAGRIMGRKRAQRELSVYDEKKRLDDMGVLHSIRGEQDLDEAPSAYKDIDAVMEAQKDLVKILHKLTPLGVIKG